MTEELIPYTVFLDVVGSLSADHYMWYRLKRLENMAVFPSKVGSSLSPREETLARKSQLVGLLEAVCASLDLTKTQYERAEQSYRGVSEWLSSASDSRLQSAFLSPQGSVALGTVVKPIGQDEFDVDLVCLLADVTPSEAPELVKALIGDRLSENATYRKMRKEKPRCWRLDYAGEFHLDITPSIRNPDCHQGGELVPDKKLRCWKPSNPKGYRERFEEAARLEPNLAIREAAFAELRAEIEDLPTPMRVRGLLRRIVQLCKRHRDVWFSTKDQEVAPISVILTTLAAESYGWCVANKVYDTELDVVFDVIRNMESFVEQSIYRGEVHYAVWNPSTEGENFAEKWNGNRRLPQAFFAWHEGICSNLESLLELIGLDPTHVRLAEAFGNEPADAAIAKLAESMSTKRAAGVLTAVPGLGLTTAQSGKSAAIVQHNTFYGRLRRER